MSIIETSLAYLSDKLSKLNFLPIPADKFTHGLAGFTIAILLTLYSVPLALLAVLVVGVGKELYDYVMNRLSGKHKHDVDAHDILATVIGGVLGIGVMSLLLKLVTFLIMGA